MALQSQAPRPTTSSTPQRLVPAVNRKGLPPAAIAAIAVGGIAVILVAVALYRAGGSGGTNGAGQPGTPSSETLAQTPTTKPNTPSTTNPAPETSPSTIPGSTPPGLGTSGGAPATPPPVKPAPTTLEMGKEPTRPLVPSPAPPAEQTPSTNPANENPVAPKETKAPTPGSAPTPETSEPLSPEGSGPLSSKSTSIVSDAQRLVEQGGRAQSAGNLVEARTLLNKALLDTRLPSNERGAIRAQLATINDSIIFSPKIAPGDAASDVYTIAQGDNLVNIRAKLSLPIDWRLLQRVNKINPSAMRVGQKIKIIKMPFHAVVHKSDFRLDLYIGDPVAPGATQGQAGPDGQDPSWTYVRSFDVGLGEISNGVGTPEGTYTVKPRSKLVNPPWINPRTGEKFAADDPKNPIGEFWIGLEGVDAAGKPLNGYGIHGTIDPDSIGKQKSMGCVRMRADDIAMMYELLTERLSSVRIVR